MKNYIFNSQIISLITDFNFANKFAELQCRDRAWTVLSYIGVTPTIIINLYHETMQRGARKNIFLGLIMFIMNRTKHDHFR
jgi:hypothetical protein